MEELEKMDLRSVEFREILGTPPRWLVQYGTTLTLIGFVIIGLFSYYFTYPDIVRAPIKISTAEAPVSIIAKEYGILGNVVAEHSVVEKGTVLAVLHQDNASARDMALLEETVEGLEDFGEAFVDFEEDENLKLGSVEAAYLSFVELHKRHPFVRVSQYHSEEINRINGDIEDIITEIEVIRDRNKAIDKQIDYYEGEYKDKLKEIYASDKSPDAHKDLLERPQKVIELRRQQDINEQAILEKERGIRELKARQLGIREGVANDKSSKITEIKFQLFELQAAINKWKEDHLINSPVSGTVYYTDMLKSGEKIAKQNARIMAIVPTDADKKIIGKIFVSPNEASKINVGQPVNIRFDAYPVPKFGLLEGTVIDKATLSNTDGKKLIQVGLDSLVTTYKKSIPFEYDMQGFANIITEDRPVLYRFFDYFFQGD